MNWSLNNEIQNTLPASLARLLTVNRINRTVFIANESVGGNRNLLTPSMHSEPDKHAINRPRILSPLSHFEGCVKSCSQTLLVLTIERSRDEWWHSDLPLITQTVCLISDLCCLIHQVRNIHQQLLLFRSSQPNTVTLKEQESVRGNFLICLCSMCYIVGFRIIILSSSGPGQIPSNLTHFLRLS